LREGASADTRLARRAKILELHGQLKSEGMAGADLDKLEDDLTKRRKARRQVEDQVAAEVAQKRIVYEGPCPGGSQSEMNRLAQADVDTANALLARALLELEMHSSTEEHARLRAAQESWNTYATVEAAYRAAWVVGGSMYPGVNRSELEQFHCRPDCRSSRTA
jgi:hypothetical protein